MTDLVLDTIDEATLRAVARSAFGTQARITYLASLEHGMSHLVYRVILEAPAVDCVFRFSRSEPDTFDAELASFAAVADLTGVTGPTVYLVDRSCTLVPTPFMAMEYLNGQEWTTLCRDTDRSIAQRDQICGQAGEFYARLHRKTVPRPTHRVPHFVWGIQLLSSADADYLRLDHTALAICEAVALEQMRHIERYTLCFSDGELYFRQEADGSYRPAFVLDLQWMTYDASLVDISTHIMPSGHFGHRVANAQPVDIQRDPFYVGYARTAQVDLDARLISQVGVWRQLGGWGFIATEPMSRVPARRRWIQSQRPEINRLIQTIIELV